MEKLKSLAGTNQEYVPVQGRIYPDGLLHIQGRGHEGNREYGVAVNVHVATAFKLWLSNQLHTNSSLADSDTQYVPMQTRLDDSDNIVRFQVQGGYGGNRDYGYAFTVSQDDPNIEPLIDWLRDE